MSNEWDREMSNDEFLTNLDSPQTLYHTSLCEGYFSLRKLSDAIQEVSSSECGGRGDMITVAECDRSLFDELNALPEPKALEKINPFPEFDRVQFYDVDPNDPSHTHYYLVPNDHTGELEEARGSGTGFIHSFFDHFDDKENAKRIALEILHRSRRNVDDYTLMVDRLVKTKRKGNLPYPLIEKGCLRDTFLQESIKKYEDENGALAQSNEDFKMWIELRDAVLDLWEWGSASGTALHRSIEIFLDNPLDAPCENMVYQTIEFRYFLNLMRDLFINGTMKVVRSEIRVCDWKDNREGTYHSQRALEENCPDILKEDLCATYLTGSADLIFREEGMAENKLGIGDWKRSKKIYMSAFGGKCGKGPCAEIPDCNLYHYYIQLNLYAYLIELNTKYKVVKMFIAVFHPNNNNYVTYNVPDMRTTVHLMLIERIKYNLTDVFTSDSEEDRRKRTVMSAFLESKKVNKTNMKELFGIESYQLKRKREEDK